MKFHWLAWLRLVDTPPASIPAECVFCHAYTTSRAAFDIVGEDEDFIAFHDHKPASRFHVQVIPKRHIGSVKELRGQDADMVTRMEQMGNEILDRQQIPPSERKMGFHIPPFCSVGHLHMHVQQLPYVSCFARLKYPVVRGFGVFDKGFSWFSAVDQTTAILRRDARVGVFPS